MKFICSVHEKNTRPNARFIFLASFNHESDHAHETPCNFEADFGASFLAFTFEELEKILKQSESTMFVPPVDFQTPVIRFIYTMTGGHVGTNIVALQTLTDLNKRTLQEKSVLRLEDITGIYLSTEFRNKLMSTRIRLADLEFSTGKPLKSDIYYVEEIGCVYRSIRRVLRTAPTRI